MFRQRLAARLSQHGTAVAALLRAYVLVRHLLVIQIAAIDVTVPIGRPDRRVRACLASRDVVRTRWHSVTPFPGPTGPVNLLSSPIRIRLSTRWAGPDAMTSV
jgi:hypothetical protein